MNKCCKTCKYYEALKGFYSAFCKNEKNPFKRILVAKLSNFGCAYWATKESEEK